MGIFKISGRTWNTVPLIEKVVAYLWKLWYKYILLKQLDGFPSGQRGQTVNLLQIASVVRIHLHPLYADYSHE